MSRFATVSLTVPAGFCVRQVAAHRVTELEFALADQRERGCGGRHHLGQRRKVEDRTGADRPSRSCCRPGLLPSGQEGDRAPADRGNGTGHAAFADRRVEQRSNPVEAVRRHWHPRPASRAAPERWRRTGARHQPARRTGPRSAGRREHSPTATDPLATTAPPVTKLRKYRPKMKTQSLADADVTVFSPFNQICFRYAASV